MGRIWMVVAQRLQQRHGGAKAKQLRRGKQKVAREREGESSHLKQINTRSSTVAANFPMRHSHCEGHRPLV